MTGGTPLGAADKSMPREVIILLPLLTFFWGINWPIMKIGIADIDVLTFRAINVSCSAFGFLMIALYNKRNLWPSPRDWRGLVPAALLNITGWNLFILLGIDLMASGRAAILGYTMPVWASLLTVIIVRERLTLRQIMGITAGMASMLLLLFQDLRIVGQNPLGTASCIFAALCWGGGTVFVRHYGFTLATSAMTAWFQAIGVVPIIILAMLFSKVTWSEVGTPAFLALLYNCTIAGVLCYYAWYRIASLIPVAVSTVSTLFIPVIGVISGILWLGEQISIYEVAALLLVIFAVAAVLLPPRRRHLLR